MSLQSCAELVKRGDPDRFLATMAAPPAARAVLFPIYAFNVEVSRAPWVTQEPLIAEMRLQFWRDALDEIVANGIVRQHEVVVPLAHVIDEVGAKILDGVVAARRADIDGPSFADEDALLAYIDATAGNLMWCAARQLEARDCERVVRGMAAAAGLARYLQAVPSLIAAGRAPLPRGCDIAALCRRVLADWPDRPIRRHVPLPAQAALLEGWQARAVLKAAIAVPDRVASGALAQSEFARRSSLLRAQLFGV